ncbi:MAG: type III pantothenate kinase [Thermodesulfobacteriota bacterium]
MLLTLDIGNTHTVLGIFQGENLLAHWRLSSATSRTEDECWILVRNFCSSESIDIKEIDGVIISSVVPNLTPVFDKMTRDYLHLEPVNVDARLDLGIKVLYEDPMAVGADRLCNSVAGFKKYGGPLIVVDFGTATTFDIVSKDGEYLGGIIAPGIETSAMDLFQRAARLPRVEMKFPQNLIGRNTEASLQAGIMYGAVELTDGMVKRIREKLKESVQVIATGGLAHLISNKSTTVKIIEPFLTLEGMRIIYDRVR